MTELEILKGMRVLLADPARWTQGAFWRDAAGHGLSCIPAGGEFQSCCLLGAEAAVREAHGWFPNVYPDALYRVIAARGFDSTSDFNDRSTHSEVLSAIDEAIAILEAKQPSTCAAVKKLIDDAVRATEPVA